MNYLFFAQTALLDTCSVVVCISVYDVCIRLRLIIFAVCWLYSHLIPALLPIFQLYAHTIHTRTIWLVLYIQCILYTHIFSRSLSLFIHSLWNLSFFLTNKKNQNHTQSSYSQSTICTVHERFCFFFVQIEKHLVVRSDRLCTNIFSVVQLNGKAMLSFT